MKILCLISAASWLMISFQLDFKKYSNWRFNYCTDYPSNFSGKGESLSGDGQIFVSTDGTSTITTNGFIVLDDADLRDNLKTGFHNIFKNKNVPCPLKMKNYFIVSGFETDGKI